MPRTKKRKPTILATGSQTPWRLPMRQAVADPVGDARSESTFTPCRVCGGPAGTRSDYSGPWRQHRDCVPLAVSPVARLAAVLAHLGIGTLAREDAALIDTRVPLFSEVHPEPVYEGRTARPWGHVDRKALATAVADLPLLRVEAGLDPSACVSGRCAWCGVERSTGWTLHGHRWADGSEAPLCGPCGTVYERHGSPSVQFWEDQRQAISEAVTGVALPMGYLAPAGLLGHAERPEGDGSAWSHLPAEAVESWRWWVWSRWPAQAPAEHRDEALRRAAQQERERSVERVRKAAEAAASADLHRFGVAT